MVGWWVFIMLFYQLFYIVEKIDNRMLEKVGPSTWLRDIFKNYFKITRLLGGVVLGLWKSWASTEFSDSSPLLPAFSVINISH